MITFLERIRNLAANVRRWGADAFSVSQDVGITKMQIQGLPKELANNVKNGYTAATASVPTATTATSSDALPVSSTGNDNTILYIVGGGVIIYFLMKGKK